MLVLGERLVETFRDPPTDREVMMKTTSTRSGPLGVALALLITAACGGEEAGDPVVEARARALGGVVDEVIVVAAHTFAKSAEWFEADASSMCERADRASSSQVDLLRRRWGHLVTDWNFLSPFYFGPLDDDPVLPTMVFIESMRRDGTDHTGTVRELIDEVSTGTAALNEAFFDALTFDQVGMLALEVLLYDSRYSNDVAAGFRAHPRRCQLLENLAARMNDRAERVRRGWVEAFGPSGVPYRAQFLAGHTGRDAEPLELLLAAVDDHFDYVRGQKLPTGADLSWSLNRGVSASLRATSALMDPPNFGSEGLAEALDAAGAEDLTWAVRIAIGEGISAYHRDDRAALTEAVGEISRLFRDELPEALGIESDAPTRE